MRTKAGILSLSAVGLALLLSSCQYTKDPNKEWKDRAFNAYKAFYAKPENQDLTKDPLFYFDVETFKGVLVRSETEVEYLGQLNFSNFSFSENPNKYFVDFGNIPMTFDDTDDDGQQDSFTFGEYIGQDESGNISFQIEKLFDNLPFVLHEDNFGKEAVKTYSMVKDGGTIEDVSNAKAYDPNFFYISDFSLSIEGAEEFTGDLLNFEGKDLAFLRNDLYSIIDSLLNQEDIQNINEFLGLSKALKNTYRRSVGIPLDQNMPTEITISGTHYSDFDTAREVVVGPISFVPTLLSHYLPEIGAAEFDPSIYDVETIRIGEGIKTIGFYAFYGERDTETGASKSNLKNIYLPSTLESIQFNAFSNLDLENVYIPKTYREKDGVITETSFETVDLGDATIILDENSDNPLELDITTSFGNSTIDNIYFEDYDNLNIQTFPYSTINFADNNERNKAIKIYHDDLDTSKFEKLSDTLATYDTVNPFYQMVLNTDQEKNKFIISSDVSTIAKGKKLYLPYFEYSLSTGEARNVVSSSNLSNPGNEVNASDAILTLKLNQDLVVEGTLIVGAEVGTTRVGSGDIVGSFSAIDLNGHKITVKDGGTIEGNGLIYDSSEKQGEILVDNGGKLTTNLTITNYSNFSDVQNRAENGVNLFDTYKFNSLKVKTSFNSGATLIANIDYASQTYVNENSFEYIGKTTNSLFNLESGTLILNSNSLSGTGSKVSINDVSLLTIEDTSSVSEDSNEVFKASTNGFNLANSDFNVNLNDVNLNTYLRCESGSLAVSNLTLNTNGKIYAKDTGNFTLLNSINVQENATNTWLLGDIKANDENAFTNLENLIKGANKGLLNYSTNVSEMVPGETLSIQSSVKNLRVVLGENRDTFTKLAFKSQVPIYYLYENGFNKGTLIGNDLSTLASYDNGEWIANNVDTTESGLENNYSTGVSSSNSTLTSFVSDDQTAEFVLNTTENKWERISHAENGIYSRGEGEDRELYIKTSANSPLIPGNIFKDSPSKVIQPIFVGSEDNALYVRKDLSNDNSWVKVESFDSYRVLKEVNSNNYFALLSGDTYTSEVSYDSSTHIVSENNENYAFTGDSFTKLDTDQKLVEGSKTTIKGADNTGYVFISSLSRWERTGLIGETLANGALETSAGEPTKYYFNIHGNWLSSVDGSSYALTYNELADYSFGVLKDRYSYQGQRFKFVMRKGDKDVTNNPNTFELFTPQGMVNVSKEDFADIWPEEATEDSFHAYRHITRENGDKYLFFMNENDEIELRRFEFAAGFTPSVPDPDNTNPLTKYNFIIYKVNFYNEDGTLSNETVTLYVNVDSSNSNNAIYAGNAEDTGSDDYLALAVYTLENPISSLTGQGSNS